MANELLAKIARRSGEEGETAATGRKVGALSAGQTKALTPAVNTALLFFNNSDLNGLTTLLLDPSLGRAPMTGLFNPEVLRFAEGGAYSWWLPNQSVDWVVRAFVDVVSLPPTEMHPKLTTDEDKLEEFELVRVQMKKLRRDLGLYLRMFFTQKELSDRLKPATKNGFLAEMYWSWRFMLRGVDGLQEATALLHEFFYNQVTAAGANAPEQAQWRGFDKLSAFAGDPTNAPVVRGWLEGLVRGNNVTGQSLLTAGSQAVSPRTNTDVPNAPLAGRMYWDALASANPVFSNAWTGQSLTDTMATPISETAFSILPAQFEALQMRVPAGDDLAPQPPSRPSRASDWPEERNVMALLRVMGLVADIMFIVYQTNPMLQVLDPSTVFPEPTLKPRPYGFSRQFERMFAYFNAFLSLRFRQVFKVPSNLGEFVNIQFDFYRYFYVAQKAYMNMQVELNNTKENTRLWRAAALTAFTPAVHDLAPDAQRAAHLFTKKPPPLP